ncbi:hypothetical protein [Serratia marcescens]|uniref:hypothetical protein n=1 Tax=Serratia marcescens TaxID=615 RepID=UPI002362EEAD|nr:hypothetical protein [Serratia marcescens]
MTTIKRFTPDYAMHAARFEPFAREAEHGEYVRFDAHQQEVSTLKAERDALAVENAALKETRQRLAEFIHEELDTDYPLNLEAETPATSAALAAIEARGVEKAAAALDALSAQSASATTQANFRAAAVYLRAEVLPAIGEAK